QAALRREGLVDHLLATLADDEPNNRRTAAITLGWLKEPRAVRPLIDMLAETALQEYATHALVSIGFQDPAAWADGLAHPHDGVREGTIRCLGCGSPAGRRSAGACVVQSSSGWRRYDGVTA